VWRILKTLKIEIQYDPVILLGIYLGKAKTLNQKEICTSMFIAALIPIVKTWKQVKSPSIDK